jgi:hypothetical protein
VVDEHEVVMEIDDYGMGPGYDFIVIYESILGLTAEADAGMDFIDNHVLVTEIQFQFGLQDSGDCERDGFRTETAAEKRGQGCRIIIRYLVPGATFFAKNNHVT